MTKPVNPPAFPCERKELVRFAADGVFDPDDPRNWAEATAQHSGMSLRDYFAGQALAGLTGAHVQGNSTMSELAARQAYEYADAMLKARESK